MRTGQGVQQISCSINQERKRDERRPVNGGEDRVRRVSDVVSRKFETTRAGIFGQNRAGRVPDIVPIMYDETITTYESSTFDIMKLKKKGGSRKRPAVAFRKSKSKRAKGKCGHGRKPVFYFWDIRMEVYTCAWRSEDISGPGAETENSCCLYG